CILNLNRPLRFNPFFIIGGQRTGGRIKCIPADTEQHRLKKFLITKPARLASHYLVSKRIGIRRSLILGYDVDVCSVSFNFFSGKPSQSFEWIERIFNVGKIWLYGL